MASKTTFGRVQVPWGLVMLALLAGAVLIIAGQVALQVIGTMLILGSLAWPFVRVVINGGDDRAQEFVDADELDEWTSSAIKERAQASTVSSLGIKSGLVLALGQRNIVSVEDVLMMDPQKLLKIPGIGPAELLELRQALATNGFLPPLDADDDVPDEIAEFEDRVISWNQFNFNDTRRQANA